MFGVLDTKASDFLDRKVFDFSPKDVVSLKVGLKTYNSQDGLYYDTRGRLDSEALKAITEISYLKFVQKKKVLALSSENHPSLKVITKDSNYSFNFYSYSKKNYVKYLDSIYELDRHCCDALKAML